MLLRFLPLATLLFTSLLTVALQGDEPERDEEGGVAVEVVPLGATGDRLDLAVILRPDSGWHLYWVNPGDAGIATTLTFQLPEGAEYGSVEWPLPHLEGDPPEVTYALDGTIVARTSISLDRRIREPELRLTGKVGWLACRDVCIPGSYRIDTTVSLYNLRQGTAVLSHELAGMLERLSADQPLAGDAYRTTATRTSDGDIDLVVEGVDRSVAEGEIYFYPYGEGIIDHSARQQATMEEGRLRLRLPRSRYAEPRTPQLRGILVRPSGWKTAAGAPIDPSRRALLVDVPLDR